MKKEQEILRKKNKENIISQHSKSNREIKEYEKNIELSIQKKVRKI